MNYIFDINFILHRGLATDFFALSQKPRTSTFVWQSAGKPYIAIKMSTIYKYIHINSILQGVSKWNGRN